MRTRSEKARLDSIIGKNMRREREYRNLTRDELAEMIDLTPSHLGLIERGDRGATAVTLSRLSRVLDISIDDLFAASKLVGYSVQEEFTRGPTENQRKIASLTACLSDYEVEFVIHIIKGMISLSHARDYSMKDRKKRPDDIDQEDL